MEGEKFRVAQWCFFSFVTKTAIKQVFNGSKVLDNSLKPALKKVAVFRLLNRVGGLWDLKIKYILYAIGFFM